MPNEAPLGTLATEGVGAYLGYRGPGGITVRRPSGASERFSAAAAPALRRTLGAALTSLHRFHALADRHHALSLRGGH